MAMAELIYRAGFEDAEKRRVSPHLREANGRLHKEVEELRWKLRTEVEQCGPLSTRMTRM